MTSITTLGNPPSPVHVDSARFKHRVELLNTFLLRKPYQRQKRSLQKQLKSYIWSLLDKKALNISSPQDTVNFLILRDKFGKIVLLFLELRVYVLVQNPLQLGQWTIILGN